MKKTLLLSVVASTMIMAGGDIAPVEPVVVAEEVSAWEFSGQAVAYTQTRDKQGNSSLWAGDSTGGLFALSIGAKNSDIFAGIGFGAEVAAIGNGYNNGYSSTTGGLQTGNALTQGYLTYGMDSINTSLKIGRQYLPKSLSPFAFTEGWQAVKNSFSAALVVNSSLPETTLVYAFVTKSNRSVGDLNNFTNINDDGVHMVTAQNGSIENLTLTGTWYIAPSMTATGDANILWGDATYKADAFTLGLQGGTVDPDGLSSTSAWGLKASGDLGMFGLYGAYTSVGDGALPIVNLGTNIKTPLYTQSVLDQNVISKDSDSLKLAASMKALGGKFGLAYIYSDMNSGARSSTFGQGVGQEGTYQEADLTYKTKIGEDTTLFAAYVYQDDDRQVDSSQNFVRFWARYNFN